MPFVYLRNSHTSQIIHCWKGSEFGRECKIFNELVVNSENKISFERFWWKLKEYMKIHHKGK